MAGDDRARLTRSELRRFGLTVGIAFGVLAGIVTWRGHGTASLVLASIGGALVAGGLIVPGALGPVQRAWMGMAHAISKVTTPVFMSIVYYLVLMPVGVLRRTIGSNPLRHAEHDGSFWADRSAGEPSDLERQF